ncbi:MAG: hypothetical protein RL419_1547, partial [Actinomycetota bacterium]
MGLVLNLDLDVNTSWQLDALQRVDGLGIRIDDVDETLVDAHLEVLSRVLVDVRSADDREAVLVGRQRNGSTHSGGGTSDGLDDFARRLVDDLVIKRLEADADTAVSHVDRYLLLDDLRDATRTNSATTLTNSKTKTLIHSNRLTQLNSHRDIV